jgi:methylated-DNA-[protein]-cysteine S-methyltransferase
MRTFTKQAEHYAGRGPVRQEPYTSAYGGGMILLAGDLPLELLLPDPAREEPATPGRGTRPAAGDSVENGREPASGGSRRWAELLERYFAGEPVEFALDVDAYADAHGLTTFERDVYRALARVPRGTAVSYRDLAAAAGYPQAYRAVGSAMARNYLPVILPCHRVVKNDGHLGYYGDDPAWKARLLTLEGVAIVGDRLARASAASSTGGGA